MCLAASSGVPNRCARFAAVNSVWMQFHPDENFPMILFAPRFEAGIRCPLHPPTVPRRPVRCKLTALCPSRRGASRGGLAGFGISIRDRRLGLAARAVRSGNPAGTVVRCSGVPSVLHDVPVSRATLYAEYGLRVAGWVLRVGRHDFVSFRGVCLVVRVVHPDYTHAIVRTQAFS